MAYRRWMDDLKAELDLLERRYGPLTQREDVTRIHTAQQRHQFELDRINSALDDLMHRRRMTLDSIESLARLEREVLQRAIDAQRLRHREAWSPTPVLAFRAWRLEDGLLCGAVEVWATESLVATCHSDAGADEVPHSDGRCGTPACGIYALKRVADIRDVTGWPVERMALGLVALSGKVVEHALGYRAQEAQILALAVRRGDGLILADSCSDVRRIVRGGISTFDATKPSQDPYTTMCLWLEARKESHETWTSESRTG